ncbi:MAG: hydroxyacid dehydrogenase [Chthoniobacteraceae bacterium]
MQNSQLPKKFKTAFFGRNKVINEVYAQGRRAQIAELTDLYPHVVDLANFQEHAPHLRDLEAIFTTWFMPSLQPEQLDLLPSLKAVFYAAGTVKPFALPFLERGITVVSAWQANAIPVAEFTSAQIVLSMKGYFRNAREYTGPAYWNAGGFQGPGNYGGTVALLGAGAIGRKVIEYLKPYHLRIVAFDPFLGEARAAELGIAKVSLEEAFEQGCVVSNHLANIPETRKMLHGGLFAKMRRDATFINTGRGATVDEPGLIEVLRARPDLTALLDVTWPEPPAEDSPFFTLPNVQTTTHIAGSANDETVRLADYCLEEFEAWACGRPLRYAVSLEMLKRMA